MTRAGSRTRHRAAYYLLPNVLALGVLFFLPIATMMRYSVLSGDVEGGWVERLTLEHYARFFTDPYYLASLGITVGTGFLVVALSLVAAYPAAHLYWRAGSRLKSALLVLLLAPFYVNIIVKVFGWMVLLSRSGLVNRTLVGMGVLDAPYDFLDGYAAILIMLVHRALPFMVLLIASSMERIDEGVLESARVCGSPPREVFRKIILPLSVPGVLAGSVLIFSLTVAAFVVPLLVGGDAGQRFVSVLMYRNISVTQNWYFGAAVGMVLLVTSVLTITLSTRAFKSMRIGRVIRESFTQ